MSDPVTVEAVLAEARERVQAKRASGVYDAEVDRALRTPLPGGSAPLIDELANPLGGLSSALQEEVEYDPRSRKRFVGAGITAARKTVIGLIRWWIADLFERQERINRLVGAALRQQAQRPSPEFEARLARLEQEWQQRKRDEVAADLNSVYFAARFSGDEPVIRSQSERFLEFFKGRERVLDLGSGRGTFLELMRDHGIGAYGVDLDRSMIDASTARGLEVQEGDALSHLRGLADSSIDGLYARHVAEHVLPGQLIAILRECRRVLRPGSPIVMITPNVASLSVGAHTFWMDPEHRRPIPPDLFHFYLEVEGFQRVEVRLFEPNKVRLSEDVPQGAERENVRLLNETLFGHRDYAVIGHQPGGEWPIVSGSSGITA